MERNRSLIQTWSAGRSVESYTYQGVPNTAGLPARLDWPALRLLPAQGQVVSAHPDLLLRAAAWYQLVSGRQANVPPDLLAPLAWISAAVQDVPFAKKSERLAEQMHDRPLNEQVLARCWLDVLLAPDQPQSQLKFVLDDSKRMHYIGH
ncbi:hypothetical protein GCM10022631_14170 [Deinococcus rubellus]|uniref:hypothetical protein n=1 Tax=Deinococcus rubellus TaxID=1889240 RepID=UPI0031E93CFB